MALRDRCSSAGTPPNEASQRPLSIASSVLQATPGVDDVAAIAEWPLPRLYKAACLDGVSGGAHTMRGEHLGKPVAPDLLSRAVVVGRHHRVGPSIVGEGHRRVGGEILDPNRIAVDNTAGEHDETGKQERKHKVGPPDQLRSSLPSFLSTMQAIRNPGALLPRARRL